MSSTIKLPPRALVLLWTTILAGPVLWSLSLSIMFALTHFSCETSHREPIFAVGIVCIVITLIAGIRAAVGFRQPWAHAELTRFMLGLAVGASALFALVIALSLVPPLFLTPCRL